MILQTDVVTSDIFSYALEKYGPLIALAIIVVPIIMRILWIQAQASTKVVLASIQEAEGDARRENEFLDMVSELREEKRILADSRNALRLSSSETEKELVLAQAALEEAIYDIAELRILLLHSIGDLPDDVKKSFI